MSPDYRMSDDMQLITLVIALFVAYFIWLGIRALFRIWEDGAVKAAIEDFADDFLTDRDQHADDIAAQMRELRAG